MNQELQTIVSSAGLVDEQLTQLQQQVTTDEAAITEQKVIIAQLNATIADLSKSPKALPGFTGIATYLNKTAWIQAGNSGDTGGSDPTKVNGTFTFTPGDVGTWVVKGNYPYNNGFWFRKNKGFESSRHFVYPLDVLFPTASDLANCQAVEFQLQQSLNGYIYNMAWQANLSSGLWRTFDFTQKAWIETDLPPVKFTPGVWSQLIAEYVTDPVAKTVRHLALTIDGQIFPVNIVRPAKAQLESNYLSEGFQLDTKKTFPAYTVQTRNMHVLY